MAGTIIADFIRTDASRLSLNVGNTTFATINASGFFSNTGTQLIAANGTVATSALSGTIATGQIADSAITRAKIGYAGAALQVLQTAITNAPATTSGTYSSTGLTVTITPSSASNKILVLPSLACAAAGSQGVNSSGYFAIYRNATQVSGDYILRSYVHGGAGTYLSMPGSSIYLDSPATTSATTYTIYFKTGASTATYLNADGQYSYLTVMEISG